MPSIDFAMQNSAGSLKFLSAQDVLTKTDLNIHFVNVGQGDCIMINLPDNKNVIIDAGQKNGSQGVYNNQSTTNEKASVNHVLGYARKNILENGEVFDYAILTHAHEDHVNVMDDILDQFDVKNIIRPPEFYINSQDNWLTQKEEELALLYGVTLKEEYNITTSTDMQRFLNRAYLEPDCQMLVTNDTIVLSGQDKDGNIYTIKFYTIDMTEYYNPTSSDLKNPNNYSPLIVLSYMGQSFAFTGDGENYVEEQLISKYGSSLPDVVLFDLAHHGSKTANEKEFVDALNPEYAIVSVGDKDIYGLPDEEVFDILQAHSKTLEKQTLSTREYGDIIIGANYISNDEQTISISLSDGIYTKDVLFSWWKIVIVLLILVNLLIFVLPKKEKNSVKLETKPQ